jgi:hypothetical protein
VLDEAALPASRQAGSGIRRSPVSAPTPSFSIEKHFDALANINQHLNNETAGIMTRS